MATPAALVTGGGTRLGAAFALYLAQEKGFDIALHYNSSRAQAEQTKALIEQAGQRCELLQCDFQSSDQPERLVDEAMDYFPGLTLLLNSASAYTAAPAAATTLAMLQQQFQVNCFVPLLLTARFAKRVGRGQVINILDNKIAYPQYHYSAYLLSKKSLADFTQMAALEFAPRVRVNGIAPGVVLPGEVRTSAYIDWRVEGIPLQRQGAVANLCQALGYLIDNEFVTGQQLFVDGGEGINNVGRNAESYAQQQAFSAEQERRSGGDDE